MFTIDKEYLSKLEKLNAKKASLEKELEERQAKALETKEACELLIDRWVKGEAVTPHAYTMAKMEAEMWRIRVDTTTALLAGVDSRGLLLDLDVAASLAYALTGEDVMGCEAVVTDTKPASAPDLSHGPVVAFVQNLATTQLGGGLLAGNVTAYLYAKSKVASLPDDLVLQTLFEQLGFDVSHWRSKPQELAPGVYVTQLDMNVRACNLPVPDVSAPAGNGDVLDRGAFPMVERVAARFTQRYTFNGFARSCIGRVEPLGLTRHGDVVTETFALGMSAVAQPNGWDTASQLAASMEELTGTLLPFVGVVAKVETFEHAPNGWKINRSTFDAGPYGKTTVRPGDERADAFAKVTVKRKVTEA